uniref:Uncharacterized protein n=1 Tax=Arion vulgaris TaxID=1028688 RepID=A0A0B7ACC2_9EUPU
MSAPECELKNSSEEQPFAPSPPLTEDVGPDPMEDVNSEEESVDQKENRLETQELRKPVDELDTEGEDGDLISPCNCCSK